jgi:hypothetical protein
MPITERHVFGWNEATAEEKLEGLHDWCNILTAKLKAADEEMRALLERIKRLESEASLRAGVGTSRDVEESQGWHPGRKVAGQSPSGPAATDVPEDTRRPARGRA